MKIGSFYRSLFVSILIHLGLIVVFFFQQKREPTEAQLNQKEKSFVEWQSFGQNNLQNVDPKNSVKNPPHRIRQLTNRKLQKLLRTDFSALAREAMENKTGRGEITDLETGLLGAAVNLEKTLVDDRLLPRVWRHVRAHVGYREEHIRERVQGLVSIRVRLDPRGKLLRLFEETAVGSRELLGWVILCLIKAFKEPFLTESFASVKTLDLNFHFRMGASLPSREDRSVRMVFPIDGSLPMHVKLAQNFKDLVADETLKNHSDWSFYEKEAIYRQSCDQRGNPEACKKLKDLNQSIGR